MTNATNIPTTLLPKEASFTDPLVQATPSAADSLTLPEETAASTLQAPSSPALQQSPVVPTIGVTLPTKASELEPVRLPTATDLPQVPSTSTPPQDASSSLSDTQDESKVHRGVFNPQARDNVVVYWGASAETRKVPLLNICQDTSINVVNLAFLTGYQEKAKGGYPTINFSGGCGGQSQKQTAVGATGLLRCPEMAQAIQECQKNGKIVLLSIGGETGKAQIEFSMKKDAFDAAAMLWGLFAGGEEEEDPELRPFPDTILDGFDIGQCDLNGLSYKDFPMSHIARLMCNSSRCGKQETTILRRFRPSAPGDHE